VAFALVASAAYTPTAQQPRTLTPGDNLVVEGIPPIPTTLVDEVQRYTESRPARFADWHPVRRELLIATRFGNTNQIHHVRTPGGTRTQVTFFNEPVTFASFEPGDGRYFVFARDVGGNEFSQLYRYDFATGRTTLLTDGGRSQNGAVVWNRRGNRIAYFSTRRNGTDRDIHVVDPSNEKTDTLLVQGTGGGWWTPLDWSPDDSRLLVEEFVSVTRGALWMVNAANGQKEPLTDPGAQVSWSSGRFSRDGRGVYVLSDKDSEFRRLGYLELGSGRFTPLTAEFPWDVEMFDLAKDGRTLAFVVNEAGISKLHLMDTATRRSRPAAGVPAGVIATLRWHANSREVAVSIASARSPSDVYSVDAGTGAVSRWTEGELGGLVASDLVEPELIRWKSFDGREISGFYYRAPSRFPGRRPVIINIHGGPESQALPGYLARNNYYLNELGVSIILPNVRGSSGYGKTFVDLDNGTKREDSVKDIGALLDWIAARPELDASRVMVTGGSYGGYMTLAVSVHYSDRLRAAVDVVGISNFNTFLKNTESYRRDVRRPEYGDERDAKMAAFFEQIAPLNNAEKIRHPLLVVQGGNDPRVPLSEAEQMVKRIRQHGTAVWYLMARDEGHGFAKKANVDFQFYATVMFVRQYLLGDR
jgi:dipeptidyl aminopeptidase/acylaminoacyl peptidase